MKNAIFNVQDMLEFVYKAREMAGLSTDWDDFQYEVEASEHANERDSLGRDISQKFVFCGTVMADFRDMPEDDISRIYHCCATDPSEALMGALTLYLKANLGTEPTLKLVTSNDAG